MAVGVKRVIIRHYEREVKIWLGDVYDSVGKTDAICHMSVKPVS